MPIDTVATRSASSASVGRRKRWGCSLPDQPILAVCAPSTEPPGSNRRRPAWEAVLALMGQGFFGSGSRNGITQYTLRSLQIGDFPRGGVPVAWLSCGPRSRSKVTTWGSFSLWLATKGMVPLLDFGTTVPPRWLRSASHAPLARSSTNARRPEPVSSLRDSDILPNASSRGRLACCCC